MIWILVVVAVVYALLSGFWGVVITDLVQFVIAMVGSIALAVIALNHVGGIDGLTEKLDDQLNRQRLEITQGQAAVAEGLETYSDAADSEVTKILLAKQSELAESAKNLPRSAAEVMSIVPPISAPQSWTFDGLMEYMNTPFFNFLVLITVMWWSNHSTDGGGYLIQRTMAAKDENHAFAANLWYNFANFALRTWPWVIVALVSMVMFEDLSDHELGEKAGYPMVMNQLLGSGLRGLLIVSFLAAFMSTIDTHLTGAHPTWYMTSIEGFLPTTSRRAITLMQAKSQP